MPHGNGGVSNWEDDEVQEAPNEAGAERNEAGALVLFDLEIAPPFHPSGSATRPA